MIFPKPLPKPFPSPNGSRRPIRGKPVTLIAAFRTNNSGILLCADREESTGETRRQVNKIHRVNLNTCSVFIAASGGTGLITKAFSVLEDALENANDEGHDVWNEHEELIESCLRTFRKQYADNLKIGYLDLLIVVAPKDESLFPLLYRTEHAMLVPEMFYAAYGMGKTISDFLADRLLGIADQIWGHGSIEDATMIAVSALIFREAQKSAGYVGFGMDLIMIGTSKSTPVRTVGSDVMEEIQAGIPTLSDSIFEHWKGRVDIPPALLE